MKREPKKGVAILGFNSYVPPGSKKTPGPVIKVNSPFSTENSYCWAMEF